MCGRIWWSERDKARSDARSRVYPRYSPSEQICHDRHNIDTFGEDQETVAMAAANPTGDPLLDARMVEEEEEEALR